jgi:protein-L-isoaspartate(D-aspartate) O-methyltransferase
MPAGDHLTSDSLLPCGFMRLRGPFAEPEYELTLGPVPHMGLIAHRPLPQRAKDFYTWLKAPQPPRPTGVIISRRKMGQSLLLWLALQEPRLCHLFARDQAATMGLVPTLFSQTEPDPWQSSVGLWLENGLAMLQQQPTAEADTFELEICGYGPDTLAAQRLVAEVQAWQTNGRPDIGGWVIDAYPLATPYTPKYNEAVLPKRWHQFILRWRDNE